MKKLLLIRHAKAVHDMSYDDYERPLKHSGVHDAEVMAERVKKEGLIPQVLVTSPSLRTQATADIFSEFLSLPKPRESQRIYEASRITLLEVINEFPSEFDFIGLVGHNPGLAQLVNYFTGESPDLTPGSIALVTFDLDEWPLLSRNTGGLKWFSSPKAED
ncbi:MAG: histidine phosphatase family protein [Bacteroidetes bacterium]|nr:histidine phosphatase family protein [Bacteroidota bacterium]